MSNQFFYIVRPILLFLIGGPLLVEIVGYFWHRLAEHEGWLGNVIRYRHWVHHEKDYPTQTLRPNRKSYKSAGSWSWYVLSVVTISAVFLLLPLPYSVPLAAGGATYALAFVDYFHKAFHVEGHWLNRFRWFHRLVRLHDIHHYQPCNYGIVFFGMDRLCGTLQESFPTAPQDNFPGLVIN